MTDYIDVTRLKPTKEFFKNKDSTIIEETRSARKATYGWLILISTIGLAALAWFAWSLGQPIPQTITGNEIVSPDSFQEKSSDAQTPPSSFSSSKPKPQGILASAKQALFGESESKSSDVANNEYKAKNMDIQTELELPEYELPLANVDLKLDAVPHALHSNEQEISLAANAEIKGFSGKLSWKNNQLRLEGSMASYKNANVQIAWKKPQVYQILLDTGSIEVENTQIPMLSGTSSGPLQIGSKLTLQTDNDQISFNDYTGSIISLTNDRQNKLLLKGHVQELQTQTSQFSMELQ